MESFEMSEGWDPFEKLDELFKEARILEFTILAGQIPNLFNDWCKARGHRPDDVEWT